ncbi:MAG: hypothetical protein ACYC3G_01005 [Minisyncoccota bacterium]
MINNSIIKKIEVESHEVQLKEFERDLHRFLISHDLPTEGILVPISERLNVLKNTESVLSRIDSGEKQKSIYLSKFLAAAASGLFDAALNYIWDETVLQLRKRVINYDLEYFYDNAVGGDKRSSLKDESDLTKLDDSELIDGAKKIGLISDLGFKHLDFIKYMRNWASAAHPNQNEITGLQLIAWLETCFKEVISLPLSTVGAKIKQLLASIKTSTLDEKEAQEIAVYFTNLNPEQIQSFALGLFGIYTSPVTENITRQNIIFLLPLVWELVSEDTRQSFGLKFAQFTANNYQKEKKLAKEFLQIVNAGSYIPDELRVVEVEGALNDLLVAHNGFNNFYIEVAFAKQLRRVVGENPKIPKGLENKYITTLVNVFLTNAYGIASGAEPIYLELIEKFNPMQAIVAVFAFKDSDQVYSKFQFDLCKKKYIQLLNILKPKIIAESVKDLIVEIEKNTTNLEQIRNNPKIDQVIKSVKILLR